MLLTALCFAIAGVSSVNCEVQTYGEEGSVYTFIGPGLNGYNETGMTPVLAELVDEAGNMYVAYCADCETKLVSGSKYSGIIESDYSKHSSDAKMHLAAIISNAYPYISMEALQKKSGIEYIGKKDAITAVQYAIWHYTNNLDFISEYGVVNELYQWLIGLDEVDINGVKENIYMYIPADGERISQPLVAWRMVSVERGTTTETQTTDVERGTTAETQTTSVERGTTVIVTETSEATTSENTTSEGTTSETTSGANDETTKTIAVTTVLETETTKPVATTTASEAESTKKEAITKKIQTQSIASGKAKNKTVPVNDIEKNKSPKTGDSSGKLKIIVIMIVAAVIMIYLPLMKKRV